MSFSPHQMHEAKKLRTPGRELKIKDIKQKLTKAIAGEANTSLDKKGKTAAGGDDPQVKSKQWRSWLAKQPGDRWKKFYVL